MDQKFPVPITRLLTAQAIDLVPKKRVKLSKALPFHEKGIYDDETNTA